MGTTQMKFLPDQMKFLDDQILDGKVCLIYLNLEFPWDYLVSLAILNK